MFANNYISTLVEDQLPEFIRSADAETAAANNSAPTFTKLLKKYYEYLEQDTKTLDVGKSLYDYIDVDTTRQDLLKYFKTKFIASFPEETELSTEKVIKAAKDFYSKKGTPVSFKFLFRALYNQEVEVFFPKEEILRASDGKWKLPQALRLSFADTLTLVSNGNVWVNVASPTRVSANGFNLAAEGITANSYIQIGNEKRKVINIDSVGANLNVELKFANPLGNAVSIYDTAKLYKVTVNPYSTFDVSRLNKRQGIGETSRTTCIIEKAIQSVDKQTGREIVEVYVSNVKRLFDAGENLVVEYIDENGETQTFKSKIISLISNLRLYRNRFGVVQTGTKYKTGDPVVIYGGLADTPDATKAIATVRNVTTGSLETVEVVQPGYFFRAEPNSYIRVLSDTGVGANVVISTITEISDTANTASYNFCTDSTLFKLDIDLNDVDGYDFANVTNRVGFITSSGNTTTTVNLNTATFVASTTANTYESFVIRITAGTGSSGTGSNVNTAVIRTYNGVSRLATIDSFKPLVGTVDITSGSSVVTSNSISAASRNSSPTYETEFADGIPGFYNYLVAGKQIEILGETRTIDSVTNNYHLTVTSAFTTTGTNAAINAAASFTTAPSGTSNIEIHVGSTTQLGKAFSYDTITLGRIRSIQLKDSGAGFEATPSFDTDSIYDTDWSTEQENYLNIAGVDYTYNKALRTIRLNSANNSFPTSNGYYNGMKLFLDVGDTSHYAKVLDYIVTDKDTSSNVKTLYLDRAFENNINQTNIKQYRLLFDLRPSVRNVGKIGKVELLSGGSGYNSTDKVEFVGTGYGANAYITVSSGAITAITVDANGEGYIHGSMPSVRILNNATGAVSTGTGASFAVYGLSDGEQLTGEAEDIGRIEDFNIINRGFDYANTPVVSLKVVDVLSNDLGTSTALIGGEAVWQGGVTNTAAEFSGTVDEVYRPNSSYAVIRVFGFSGSINTANPFRINTATGNVSVTALSQNANISFNDVNPIEDRAYPFYYGDGTAKANAEFLRGLIKYEGFYLNTDGFLSADKKLQNKDYYHNFSYEIQSEKSLEDYKETIYRVAHPSGMQLLSKFLIKDQIDQTVTISSNVHTSNLMFANGELVNVNASFSSNVLYGNGSSWLTEISNNDILIINTTDTNEYRQYARSVANVNSDTQVTLDAPLEKIGEGRLRFVAGNANATVYSNTTAVNLLFQVNNNITFNIAGTEYRKSILEVSGTRIKLNSSTGHANANVLYKLTPVYNVVGFKIIKTNG